MNDSFHRRAKEAEATHGKEYVVLIIVSDCCIIDQVETTRMIVEASGLPLSLIIVGMGQNDFHFMDVLDGDVKRLSFRGKKAERDVFTIDRSFIVDGPVCII